MRRYIRTTTPGATLFFTVVLQDRQASTLTEHREWLGMCMRSVQRAYPFSVEAMVVFLDHLHAIWRLPPDDGDYAKRWSAIKGEFTKGLVRTGVRLQARGGKGERAMWQRRFWEHHIRDERDLAHHVDYVHYNPVKHGLVSRAVDWPWSSFHRFVRQGRLPADWGLAKEAGALSQPTGWSGHFGE